MIKKSTRVRKGEFAENDVTPCHFVTPSDGRDFPLPVAMHRGSAVLVRRSYQPESAALEALVEALYGLLVDSPSAERERASDASESSCFPAAHE